MLEIKIPKTEMYDENKSEFINVDECVIHLEHSLISISKWESKYHKPFLNQKKFSNEEIIDYIKCMTIERNVRDSVYLCIPYDEQAKINNYISDPMTATTIQNRKKNVGRKEIVTSELIYFWMNSYGIPMECEKWHLNRLMTLIQIHAIKNSNDKMSKQDLNRYNRQLNAARKARMGTRG